jgi:hypothetical protein
VEEPPETCRASVEKKNQEKFSKSAGFIIIAYYNKISNLLNKKKTLNFIAGKLQAIGGELALTLQIDSDVRELITNIEIVYVMESPYLAVSPCLCLPSHSDAALNSYLALAITRIIFVKTAARRMNSLQPFK